MTTPAPASDSFAALLKTFADTVQANQGRRLAMLFTARYSEAFDRGVALVQLAFPAERIRRILENAVAAQNQLPEARRPLDRFSPGCAG